MHALLRADWLARCVHGSEDPDDFKLINHATEVYEPIRWPGHKN
jgi:hypothetical protein